MAGLKRIAVVGASLAGLRAAEALRQQGFSGTLTLIGAESHLPYDRPPLSKEVLRGTWEPERASLIRGDSFEKLELELRLGRRAISLDPQRKQIELGGGQQVPFDGLLIATGAAARQLPGVAEIAGVHTLRTLDDCLAIASELERGPRVAVVGAGFIGAEVAATCRQRGLDVTLIESLPVPLEAALGADVGQTLAAAHRDEGVELRLGVGVAGVDGGERVERVLLSDGSRVEADLVVVGIGVLPTTDWLRSSGIALDDGVVCDATCATSLPGVFAAGDIASWHNPTFDRRMRVEHWSNAAEQGRAAALSLLAGAEHAVAFESVPFFWSDQYELKIQSAGLLAGADETRIVHGSLEERRFVKLYARKGRFVGALAWNEPRRLMGFRRQLRQKTSWEEALASADG